MIHLSTRNRFLAIPWSVMFLLRVSANVSSADEGEMDKRAASSPTVNDQVLDLEAMCATNAKAMTDSSKMEPLSHMGTRARGLIPVARRGA